MYFDRKAARRAALFSAVVEAAIREWSDASSEQDHLLTDDIGQRLRHHALAIINDARGNVTDYDPKPDRTVCRDCGE